MALLPAVYVRFLPLIHTANAVGTVQCFPALLALLLNSLLRLLLSIYVLFSKYQFISNSLTGKYPDGQLPWSNYVIYLDL